MPKCVITIDFEMPWNPWEDDRELFSNTVALAIQHVVGPDLGSMTIDVEFPGSVVYK